MGEIPKNQPEGKGGCREQGRPVGGVPRDPSELRIGDRLGHDCVDRTLNRIVVETIHDHGSEIDHVDTGHPLMARTEPSAQGGLKNGLDELHGPTVPTQYETDPESHDTHAQSLGLHGFRLPGLRHLGEESFSRWRLLVSDLAAGIAIESDGGCADEAAGSLRRCRDTLDQALRSLNPAFHDPATFFPGPESDDGFAGKMNKPIAARNIQRFGEGKQAAILSFAPAEEHNLIAARLRRVAHLISDEAGASCNADDHGMGCRLYNGLNEQRPSRRG